MRKKKTLAEKQRAMKKRIAKRPKAHPRRKWHGVVHTQWTPGGEFRLRRRIVARILLRKGWNVGQVATHFGVPTEAVIRWKLRGMPIIGDKQVAQLFADESSPSLTAI